MTQPPNAPGDDQPQGHNSQHQGPPDPGHQYPGNPYSGQSGGQQNQWITSSGQSAGRPEDTQHLPPQGQGPAGQPYAGSYSQPYTGQPYEQAQPWAGNQSQGGPPGQGSFGGWQPQQPQPQHRIKDANPLRAAFDFSFRSYATPGIAKIVYIVAIVLGVLWWIGGSIYWFVIGALITHAAQSLTGGLGGGSGSSGGGGFTTMGILSLVLGWIPVALWVLVVRVFLEAAVAMIRTAGDARVIREKVED